MKFVKEFRDPDLAVRILQEIARVAQGDFHFKLMEVCGGHTHTIYKSGLQELLPANVELVHGPGCPVCVMPMGRLDDAMYIASQDDVILTTFGDMMRVPSSTVSLLDAKAAGADIRMVYSPLDALALAVANPEKYVVFFAVGFETTAPASAVTLLRAQAMGLENFSLFSNHVLIEPALRALLDSPGFALDGFIGPGHLCTITGTHCYQFLVEEYSQRMAVAGFEPLDVLQAILMLLRQIREGRCAIENQYTRVVKPDGNIVAQKVMARTMCERESFEWRGLGQIPRSALRLRPEFARYDAEVHFPLPGKKVADSPACQCGLVLQGAIKPWQCKVFGTACTPEHPIGTCMVSAEGACAAYYNYGRLSAQT